MLEQCLDHRFNITRFVTHVLVRQETSSFENHRLVDIVVFLYLLFVLTSLHQKLVNVRFFTNALSQTLIDTRLVRVVCILNLMLPLFIFLLIVPAANFLLIE